MSCADDMETRRRFECGRKHSRGGGYLERETGERLRCRGCSYLFATCSFLVSTRTSHLISFTVVLAVYVSPVGKENGQSSSCVSLARPTKISITVATSFVNVN